MKWRRRKMQALPRGRAGPRLDVPARRLRPHLPLPDVIRTIASASAPRRHSLWSTFLHGGP
jgi:hypothetical protein